MPRLVYVVTHPMTARYLMRGQLVFMRQHGFDVTVISAPGEDLQVVKEREGVATIAVPLKREVSLLHDLAALRKLLGIFRKLRPEIVNAGTPKAGLLGMLAARMTGVPVRIYTLRGLRLETTQGVKRAILSCSERLASAAACRVFCVSKSLAQTYGSLYLAPQDKITVLGSGSSNGVDVARFRRSEAAHERARVLKSQLGIASAACVIGFVGRLTQDKGVVELLEAFQLILRQYPEVWLLLVGDFETGDSVPGASMRQLKEHPQVILTGFTNDPLPYYELMNVVAFPSYREGFPNVPLEAAAMGVPVVGFRTTGTVDVILDGVTGSLVPLHDTAAFAEAIGRYLGDHELRRRHGQAARLRVEREFRQEMVWELLYLEYIGLLREKGLSLPRPLPEVKVGDTQAPALYVTSS